MKVTFRPAGVRQQQRNPRPVAHRGGWRSARAWRGAGSCLGLLLGYTLACSSTPGRVGVEGSGGAGGSGGGMGGGGGVIPPDDGTRGSAIINLGLERQSQGLCAAPSTGAAPLRRISRIDFDNAMRDLFGTAGSPGSGFVPAEQVGGYESNSRTPASGLALEQYLSAVETISDTVSADFSSYSGCSSLDDTACSWGYVSAIANRAWRGQVEPSELEGLNREYLETVAELGGQAGLRYALQAVLLSPHFLYAIELGQGDEGVRALDGRELAARLARLLWRSVPDEPLLALADSGGLASADQVAAQARAMLDDVRAESMIRDFGRQWMRVGAVPSVTKSEVLWPNFTIQLAADLLEEAQLFFLAATRAGTLTDLFLADATVANAGIASFYGYPTVPSAGFQQVPLPPERRGVLSLGAVLASNGHFERTSVVNRGKLVRDRFLCDPVQPPPATVDTTLTPIDTVITTERQAAEAHVQDATCANCHRYLDPIGFGFLHFDSAGVYVEGGESSAGTIEPISNTASDDVAGPFNGLTELGSRLAGSVHAQQCYAVQSLRFALGREETSNDACSAASVWQAFEGSGFALKEVLIAIAASDTFRHRPAFVPGGTCL